MLKVIGIFNTNDENVSEGLYIEVSDHYILFSDGSKLYSSHKEECCESHHLDFSQLDMQVFNGLFFDLSNDNFFKKIPEYGIALLPLNGHPIPVPGYGSNNGNYSTNLFLTLQRANGIMSKYNIKNCQTITWDD